MTNFKYSNHSLEELEKRQIKKEMADDILKNPQQIIKEKDGRIIHQSVIEFENKKKYLIRIIIDVSREQPLS